MASDRDVARLLRHAAISLDREPGCHRFDIQQECNDPTLFLLVEEYADEALEALAARIAAGHGDVDIETHRGDQPLYPIIMSAE